jgi:hypothetical protein
MVDACKTVQKTARVGEKFMHYLEAAEKDAEFRAELPAFVAEIKTIFEQWQLAEYLEKAGWTEPFDPTLYDEDDEDYDPADIEMERNRGGLGTFRIVFRHHGDWSQKES